MVTRTCNARAEPPACSLAWWFDLGGGSAHRLTFWSAAGPQAIARPDGADHPRNWVPTTPPTSGGTE